MPPDLPARFNIAAYFVDRPAEEHPERLAIAGEPVAASYPELAELVRRAGNALRRLGCAPGDRVLIVLPDSVEFIAAFFGAARIGAVAVPVNPFTRAEEYAFYLADSAPRVAIVHASTLPEFLKVAEGRSSARLAIVGEATQRAAPPGAEDWARLIATAPRECAAHLTAATDPAFFLYTSGSGGTPKAAVHAHKDMLVCARSFAQDVLGIRPNDRTFSVSKLFFAYGLGNGMYFPFSVGATTVLNPERPRPERVVEMVARYRPTLFFAVPTFYAALLREAERGLATDFSSVRIAGSAGEVLPREIFEQFRERFGLEILDGIGSTEMLHIFIGNRPGHARAGTCGIEVPGYEATIVDDEGKPVGDGQIGNLWVKGESAFAGYWNKPELTARSRRGDWVVTGDKFVRDAEGFFHFCGRTDDMLKVSGMWVSPGEVENVLLGHPAVAEAAVAGSAGPGAVTRPVAHVVLRAGAHAGPELAREILNFVRGRLASFKCPQEVRFLAKLPKTATGKVQRFRLRPPAGG